MTSRIAVVVCVLAGSVGCMVPAQDRCEPLLGTYKETAEETYGSWTYEDGTPIPDGELAEAIQQGEAFSDRDRHILVDPLGTRIEVPLDQVANNLYRGYRLETDAETQCIERRSEARRGWGCRLQRLLGLACADGDCKC